MTSAVSSFVWCQNQKRVMRSSELHLAGLKEEGLRIPEPSTHCQYVEATALANGVRRG